MPMVSENEKTEIKMAAYLLTFKLELYSHPSEAPEKRENKAWHLNSLSAMAINAGFITHSTSTAIHYMQYGLGAIASVAVLR